MKKKLSIKPLENSSEANVCALMMAGSEPWITLKRDYQASFHIINDPLREVHLAEMNSKIAGFIILVMQGAFIGYIQSICVAPKWRGQGVGSQLMDFAEARIFSETPNVFILVSSFNEGAQRIYRRRGYEVIGRLKDYIVPGHDEIFMRKTIGPLNHAGIS